MLGKYFSRSTTLFRTDLASKVYFSHDGGNPGVPLPTLFKMPITSTRSGVALFLVLLFAGFSWALKFDLAGHASHSKSYERCIRNYASRDTLVVVTATVDGSKGDGQVVTMQVSYSAQIARPRLRVLFTDQRHRG